MVVKSGEEPAALEPRVHGVGLDSQSRCAHYNGPLDIVAIKMRCCRLYYACRECHDALADHPADVWPRREWNETAMLCGACGEELTVRQYLDCGDRCPACLAGFNPGCKAHHRLYFAA
jgi:uncharacterized CHY-type Zn-finger protein